MAVPLTQLLHLKPAAATPAAIYTVPVGRRARIRLFAVDVGGAGDVALAWLIANGEVRDDDINAFAYGIAVGANQRVPVTDEFMYISEEDSVEVSSTGGNTVFTLNTYEDDLPA